MSAQAVRDVRARSAAIRPPGALAALIHTISGTQHATRLNQNSEFASASSVKQPMFSRISPGSKTSIAKLPRSSGALSRSTPGNGDAPTLFTEGDQVVPWVRGKEIGPALRRKMNAKPPMAMASSIRRDPQIVLPPPAIARIDDFISRALRFAYAKHGFEFVVQSRPDHPFPPGVKSGRMRGIDGTNPKLPRQGPVHFIKRGRIVPNRTARYAEQANHGA